LSRSAGLCSGDDHARRKVHAPGRENRLERRNALIEMTTAEEFLGGSPLQAGTFMRFEES
jgi:hypothetical protein